MTPDGWMDAVRLRLFILLEDSGMVDDSSVV